MMRGQRFSNFSLGDATILEDGHPEQILLPFLPQHLVLVPHKIVWVSGGHPTLLRSRESSARGPTVLICAERPPASY